MPFLFETLVKLSINSYLKIIAFFNYVQRADCEVKEIMAKSVALHPHAPILTVSCFVRSAVLYVKMLGGPLT